MGGYAAHAQPSALAREWSEREVPKDFDSVSTSSGGSSIGSGRSKTSSRAKNVRDGHIRDSTHHLSYHRQHKRAKEHRRSADDDTGSHPHSMRPQDYEQDHSRPSQSAFPPQRPPLKPLLPTETGHSSSSLSSGSSGLSSGSSLSTRTSDSLSTAATHMSRPSSTPMEPVTGAGGASPNFPGPITAPTGRTTVPAAFTTTASSYTVPTQLAVMPDPATAHTRTNSAPTTKQPYDFYTLENLPSHETVRNCIESLYRARMGLLPWLCPVSKKVAWEMVEMVYHSAENGSAPGTGYADPYGAAGRPDGFGPACDGGSADDRTRKHEARSILCQVLLLAALGSQVADDLIDEEVQAALFTSGRWYLDVAFGRDAAAPERIRANILAGLYLVLAKNIAAKEYLNMAMTMAMANGFHRIAPPKCRPQPAASTSLPTIPTDRADGGHHRNGAASPASPNQNARWRRDARKIWLTLLFLDGWVSSSVGSMPHMLKPNADGMIAISEDYVHTSSSIDAAAYSSTPAEHLPHMHQELNDPRFYNPTSSAPVYASAAGYVHHHTPQQYGHAQDHHPAQHAIHSPTGTAPQCEPEDIEMHIAQQLASLGVLMGTITNDVVAPETVHIMTIKNHSERLKAWHANLPEFLTLNRARNWDGYACPTLLIHCAYLNSIILLTRRLHLEKVVSDIEAGGAGYADESSELEEYSEMCVSAGGQLAQVVGMLRESTQVSRRCWLIIQSAYTAALVICLDLCIRRGRPMYESAFNHSISLIIRCLEVLQHCAVFDNVAASYLKILNPIHETLISPEPSPSVRRSRTYEPPPFQSNEALTAYCIELMRTPFGGEGSVVDHECFAVKGNWPEGYRFLYQSAEGEGRKLKIPVSGVKGLEKEEGRREYPRRTRQEFEEFFKRTS